MGARTARRQKAIELAAELSSANTAAHASAVLRKAREAGITHTLLRRSGAPDSIAGRGFDPDTGTFRKVKESTTTALGDRAVTLADRAKEVYPALAGSIAAETDERYSGWQFAEMPQQGRPTGKPTEAERAAREFRTRPSVNMQPLTFTNYGGSWKAWSSRPNAHRPADILAAPYGGEASAEPSEHTGVFWQPYTDPDLPEGTFVAARHELLMDATHFDVPASAGDRMVYVPALTATLEINEFFTVDPHIANEDPRELEKLLGGQGNGLVAPVAGILVARSIWSPPEAIGQS